LNQFLQRFAIVNQKANSAQTYVCCERGTGLVAGFYSLVVGSVEPSSAASRVINGLAQHPVPVMTLARLAIDMNHQNAGLGRALLKDVCCAHSRPPILPVFELFWFMPKTTPPETGICNGDSSQVQLIRIISFC